MRSKLGLLLAVLLVAGHSPALAASSVAAGKPCTKSGATSKIGSKVYKCVKKKWQLQNNPVQPVPVPPVIPSTDAIAPKFVNASFVNRVLRVGLTARYGHDLKVYAKNDEDIKFLSNGTIEVSPRSGFDQTYIVYYTVSRASGCPSVPAQIDIDFKNGTSTKPTSSVREWVAPKCLGPLDPFNVNRPSGPEATYVGELVAQFLKTLSKTPPQKDVTFIVDPRLKDTLVERGVREGVLRGLRLLSALDLIPKQPHEVLIAADTEWALPYLVDTRGCADGFCQVPNSDGSVVFYSKGITLVDTSDMVRKGVVIWQDIDEEDEFGRMVFPSGIVHEMGHWAQREIQRRNTNTKLYIYPSWLREGTADLIKMIAYAEATGKSWSQVRNTFLRYYQEKCLGIDFAELGLPGATGDEQAACEYTNGWIMVEYLIWKTKDFYSWQKLYDAPSGGGLADGLAQYSIDLEEFEKEVDAYVFREACNWLKSCPQSLPHQKRYLDQKYLFSKVPTRQSDVAAPDLVRTSFDAGMFTLSFAVAQGGALKVAADEDASINFEADGRVTVRAGTSNPATIRVYSQDADGKRSMLKRVRLDFTSGRAFAWLSVP